MFSRALFVIAAGALAVLSPGLAGAADLPVPGPGPGYTKAPGPYLPYAPVFTWSGLYFGIHGGYGFGSSTLTGAGTSNDVSPKGFIGGSTLGYNLQAGSIVYGVEGDLAYSWMEDTAENAAPCPNCDVRNKYLATVRGRLGYAMDRWMPYITGGVAFGDIQVRGPTGANQQIRKTGWAAGAGVEYALGFWNMSTKLEYLYADLGTATCDVGFCPTPVDVDYTANIVRLGINVRY